MVDKPDKPKKIPTHKGSVSKELRTGYLRYSTAELMQILQGFCASWEGQHAKVMVVMPEGRSPLKREFDIKEIRLVENKIIGSEEKYRLVVMIQ